MQVLELSKEEVIECAQKLAIIAVSRGRILHKSNNSTLLCKLPQGVSETHRDTYIEAYNKTVDEAAAKKTPYFIAVRRAVINANLTVSEGRTQSRESGIQIPADISPQCHDIYIQVYNLTLAESAARITPKDLAKKRAVKLANLAAKENRFEPRIASDPLPGDISAEYRDIYNKTYNKTLAIKAGKKINNNLAVKRAGINATAAASLGRVEPMKHDDKIPSSISESDRDIYIEAYNKALALAPKITNEDIIKKRAVKSATMAASRGSSAHRTEEDFDINKKMPGKDRDTFLAIYNKTLDRILLKKQKQSQGSKKTSQPNTKRRKVTIDSVSAICQQLELNDTYNVAAIPNYIGNTQAAAIDFNKMLSESLHTQGHPDAAKQVQAPAHHSNTEEDEHEQEKSVLELVAEPAATQAVPITPEDRLCIMVMDKEDMWHYQGRFSLFPPANTSSSSVREVSDSPQQFLVNTNPTGAEDQWHLNIINKV